MFKKFLKMIAFFHNNVLFILRKLKRGWEEHKFLLSLSFISECYSETKVKAVAEWQLLP